MAMALVSGPGRGGARTSDVHLSITQHVAYIQALDKRRDELDYWLTEHLRLAGLYWGLTACFILKHPHTLPRSDVIDFALSCMCEDGGFGAAPGHDSHVLYTCYGVQVLAILDAFDELEARVPQGTSKIGKFLASRQNPTTGAFSGDRWGETDTRFLYAALNALSLLHLTHLVDTEACIRHVQACANFDGGYGTTPDAESHAGQVFTCVGALAILGRLDLIDHDKMAGWLAERQLPHGGLNGRPEKLEDSCYSWWVLSPLAIIDRLHWIDGNKLSHFILRCQDADAGGIADRPGDMVDVFHTHFGIAGLSLIGYEGLDPIDPVYCLPRSVTNRLFGRSSSN